MFKFLDPSGCTYHHNKPFAYNLPQRGQKVGDWTEHPDPAPPDGRACGPGRLHIMLTLNAIYAPKSWHPWWVAETHVEIGRDGEKISVQALRLRRINRYTFWRCLRPPFNWGCDANLRYANLRGADLHDAGLSYADLSDANLRYANLRGADLHDAGLSYADLRGADLRGADLHGADLHGADLHGASHNQYTTWPQNFKLEENDEGPF